MIKSAIIILFIVGVYSQDIQEELGVLVLNDSNFDQVIKKYDFILADFYAPWCGHCNDLAPHYAQAARTIRSSTVQFAKIDCTQNQMICQRYQISGYPSLKFFSNQNNVDYTGGRSTNEIVEWVKKRINVGSQEIKKLDILRNLILQHQVIVIFFGNIQTAAEYAIFQGFAKKNNEILPTAHVLSSDLASEYKITSFPSIILFKQFDERRVIYDGEFTNQQITSFVERNQYPSLMTFDFKTSVRIFGGTKPTLFLLSNQNSQKAEKQLRLATSSIKEKILLCLVNINDHYGSRLATYLNIESNEIPKLIIVEPDSINFTQLPQSQDITSQNIIDFVGSYKNNIYSRNSDL